MIPLFSAVLLASLLGSLHCAGMCGAFVAFAVAGVDERAPAGLRPPRWLLNASYNGGRLITYTILGAIAGALGSAVDFGGSAVGVQRSAAILAGAIMVGFGLVTALRLSGVRIARLPLPPGLDRLVTAGHRAAMRLSPARRALAIGMLTTLLPCGWLYAFAVTAAGTAHPLLGAGTMAVFWAGTLPVMASLGAGIQSLAGPLRRRVPLATAVILVIVGLFTIVGRLRMPPVGPPDSATLLINDQAAIGRVQGLDPSNMPCCNAK